MPTAPIDSDMLIVVNAPLGPRGGKSTSDRRSEIGPQPFSDQDRAVRAIEAHALSHHPLAKIVRGLGERPERTPPSPPARTAKTTRTSLMLSLARNVHLNDLGPKQALQLRSVVERLIREGEAVNGKDADRATALHKAVDLGSMVLVDVLLDHGANVKHADKDGIRALAIAACHTESVPLIDRLIEAGADLHAVDREGNTALHSAVESLNLPGSERLMAHGADPHRPNKQGQTPLDMAQGMASRSTPGASLAQLAKTLQHRLVALHVERERAQLTSILDSSTTKPGVTKAPAPASTPRRRL